LLAGRREFPAVHISHPAASEDSSVYYLLLWSENLQRRYFFMQKSSNDLFSRIFESSREFKKVTTITTCAMFGALSVVLGYYSFKITPNLKIGFGSIPNMLVDYLFGPVVGMMAGVCTDVLGYFAGNLSMGAYFPGYTLTAVVGGLIWGLWLYPRKITVWRAIGAKTCINLFCNICLNTLWLTVTGGKAMSVLLVTRVPKNLILLPIEIVLVYFGMKLVNRIYGALPNGKTAAENS